MREILFRGKRVDNGEWVYGNLNYGTIEIESIKDSYFISDFNVTPWDKKFYPVISETVGQSTGLTDKNGRKIFEGDIVKATGLFPDRDGEQRIWRQFRVGEVFYYHGAFFFGKWGLQKTSEKCIEIIGNIYDNPELLEVKE